MLARRAALALGLTIASVSVARAQSPEEATATFRKELDALLDRWNDAPPPDRLAKAIELCESHLKASKGDDKDGDLDVRLELIRLKLAKGDVESAASEAMLAEKGAVEAPAERKVQAKVLYMTAFERSANQRLTKLKGEEQKKGIEDFKKADHDLTAKLVDLAGGMDKAKEVYRLEDQKIRTAMTLNELGKTPKAIDKNDLDGKPIKLAEYAGKVVLVDFWATWCAPCMGEMPNVLKVYQEYKDKGFEIVGISLDQDRAKLDAVLKEKGMTWRQYFDGKGWGNDVAVAWGVHSIPHTCLIDHTGRVRYVDARGEGLAAAVKLLVERAEKAKASAPAQPKTDEPKKGD